MTPCATCGGKRVVPLLRRDKRFLTGIHGKPQMPVGEPRVSIAEWSQLSSDVCGISIRRYDQIAMILEPKVTGNQSDQTGSITDVRLPGTETNPLKRPALYSRPSLLLRD